MIALTLMLLGVWPGRASAQSMDEPSASARLFRWSAEPWGQAFYVVNPSKLSPGQLADMGKDRPADLASRRYARLRSPNDLVISAGAGGRCRVGRLKHRRFDVELAPALHLHTLNPALSWGEVELRLAQELGPAFDLHLDTTWTSSRMYENRLVDAVDTDGDGSISDGERRYHAERFAELETRFLGAWHFGEEARNALEVFVGGGGRRYRRLVEFLDRRTVEFGGRVVLAGRPGFTTRLGYTFAANLDHVDDEVVLLDEDKYGLDFNGDGDTIDQNVRRVERVDHGSRDHQFDIDLRWKPQEGSVGGRFGLGARYREYTSSEPFDRKHKGRRQLRLEVRAELHIPVTERGMIELGGAGELAVRKRVGQAIGKTKVDYLTGGLFAQFVWRF